MSRRTIKPVRIESLLAGVLNVGTLLASVVIVAGLVLSLFNRTPFPTGAQVVTAGIGLFILLPILRVILMLATSPSGTSISLYLPYASAIR